MEPWLMAGEEEKRRPGLSRPRSPKRGFSGATWLHQLTWEPELCPGQRWRQARG